MKKKDEHPKIAELRDDKGGWLSLNKVGTDRWSDGALEALDKGLEHLEPISLEPRAIVLTLGVDYPLNSPVFRILAITALGLWIDSGEGRMGADASMIPWPAIFTLSVHSDRPIG